ncbi:MAG: cobyric acid synthase [Treponema sp.]|jgi:adenosylcobyric acid synthase|nr:cobyric acid synthase [Treponema sp.]
MKKAIMIQGTMSNAGKSLITAGLCRVFHQDGYSVAPFKSQNMALNSFITEEGLEMGRAQVVQAEAAGVIPSVLMNPILLKPVTDMGSQVIVNGEVRGNMKAAEYFAYKKNLVPEVMRAFNALASRHDIIVIEGAGSPAEINLKQNDIVNMGLAKMTDASVLLVGDIDRGGVFAQLVGTLILLDDEERDRIKGLIINKFRGDIELLHPGLTMLEEKAGKPVIGTIPYLKVDIEDEDSLTERFSSKPSASALDIAIIRLPKISNFTDFMALEASEGVGLRYIREPRELGRPDMVILPGTKNTISDLKWLRQNGLEAAIMRLAKEGVIVFGVCGGYQMMGHCIRDKENTEGGGEISGLGLLPISTDFHSEKTRLRAAGKITGAQGALSPLNGSNVEGYEIHMGVSRFTENAAVLVTKENGDADGCACGNVAGTYLHGFFDSAECRTALIKALCAQKGISAPGGAFDFRAYKEEQYNKLADAVRKNLDMGFIYEILGISR